MRAVPCACLLVLTVAGAAAAQPAIFVVRHAERADAGAPASGMAAPADPDLSPEGQARADALARLLEDAEIRALYVTEFRRTAQTADPLARALGLRPKVVSTKEQASLVRELERATGNVLVVGHSNTVPEIVHALGVKPPVSIGEQEYDNLLIVVRAREPVLLRLRYPGR